MSAAEGSPTREVPSPSPGSEGERARPVRRAPAIVVLAAALVVAALAGPPSPRPPAGPTPPADPVVMPPEGTRSSAWYCGAGRLVPVEDPDLDDAPADAPPDDPDLEGTTGEGGLADPGGFEAVDERVSITNLGDEDTSVRVTVMGVDEEPSGRQVPIPAGEVHTVDAEAFAPVRQPGVVVEPFSDSVVVEQLVGDEDGAWAAAPCATEPARSWWFPAGTTVLGTEQWLSLFNPFGDDAVVDVEFVTSEGRRSPERLSGLVVARTSRRVVAVHEVVRRDDVAAVSVTARSGRVVASQTIVFTGDEDPRAGIGLSTGAVAPASRWYFADGQAAAGAVRRVVVANPGEVDVDVDVLVLADDDAGLVFDPVTVSVPRRSAAVVEIASAEGPGPDDADGPDDDPDPGDTDPGGTGDDAAPESGEFVEPVAGLARVTVPAGVGYALALEVLGDGAVVAEDLAWWTDDAGTGAVAGAGTSRPARRWVFGRRSFASAEEVRFAVLNPQERVASVTVTVLGGDDEPATFDVSALAPRGWMLPDPSGTDGAVVVTSDRPVVVERVVTGSSDRSRGPGIPAR